MGQQCEGVSFDALHQQLGVQKFESGLIMGLLAHHVERWPGFRQSDLNVYDRQKDERDVEQITMQSPEKLQLFTSAKFVPASDETLVSLGRNSRGRGITRQHVACVTIPVGVREICGCRIGAVGQESL